MALRAAGGVDLVGHQRDQRADHEGQVCSGEAGQLVAEALAAAGRHHDQAVAAIESRLRPPRAGRAGTRRSPCGRAGRRARLRPRTAGSERQHPARCPRVPEARGSLRQPRPAVDHLRRPPTAAPPAAEALRSADRGGGRPVLRSAPLPCAAERREPGSSSRQADLRISSPSSVELLRRPWSARIRVCSARRSAWVAKELTRQQYGQHLTTKIRPCKVRTPLGGGVLGATWGGERFLISYVFLITGR